jgi:hypothetical protein
MFSSLYVGVFVYTMQIHSQQKQPNFKFKTWPKQLLGSLPLAFALPHVVCNVLFRIKKISCNWVFSNKADALESASILTYSK